MSPTHSPLPSSVRRLLAIITATFAVFPALAQAAYRDDIGFTKLQAELGPSMPTGGNVAVSQVEASVVTGTQQTWAPDPFNAEFSGKTITQVFAAPAGLYSGHATAIGQDFYGNTISTSPAINTIAVYWANRWLFNDFLTPNGTRRPLSSTSRIANHSWIGTTLNTTVNPPTTSDPDLLRRLDWVIENDDMLQVVSHAASGGPNGNPLLSSAFNVIAVGQSGDTVNTGSAAADPPYLAGRVRPDVVAPADSPSTAAGLVSSLVALLVQTGHAVTSSPSYTNRANLLIRNTERAEVIKAALMAGADRVTANTAAANLALYRDTPANQTSNGLDLRYGAGQVNIRNSYWIIASGERNSVEDGGSGSATRGFDYDPAFGGSSSNSTANYALPVAATPQLLTASLVWTLDINGGTSSPNVFNGAATLRDLALSVVDTGPVTPVVVYSSQSATENTENAWIVIPAGAHYALRVDRGSGSAFSYDYAIAWQALPDTDGDGAHDGQDNCVNVPNGPMVGDAGGNSQLDADGDGYGNICDADLNNSGLVTAADYNILRNSLNTADPVADLNGSGLVTTTDYSIARASLNAAPGPSGLVP